MKKLTLEASLPAWALLITLILLVGAFTGMFLPSRLDPVRQCTAGVVWEGKLKCTLPLER